MATNPGEVLDRQQLLYSALRNPPAGPVKFFNELYAGLEYVARREPGTLWVRASLASMFAPARSGAEFLDIVRKPLYAAPGYQVTADIVSAVTSMYTKTADESGTVVLADEVPAPTGFMWLEEPVVLTDAGGMVLATQALSWGPQSAPWHGGLRDGLRLTSWGEGPLNHHWPKQASDGLPMVLQHSQFVPFGQNLVRAVGQLTTGNLTVSAGKSPDDLLHWVHTLWMFMGTEIVSSERAEIPRQFRRRAARVAGNDQVNVVLLRRVRRGDREVGHRDIDWACRWVVQAHERHLGSPAEDEQAHHARVAGPGQSCLVCTRRTTHIRAYVKGPDGLPLKAVPETVYRVAR
jgi:hypothetical protein